MSKSVLSNAKECLVCGTTQGLHRHHIYPGKLRQLSEQEGCWVWLCAPHHNTSDAGVHFNPPLDYELRRMCQKAWQAANGKKKADFLALFGRSYL